MASVLKQFLQRIGYRHKHNGTCDRTCHRLEGVLIAAATEDDTLGDGYRDNK
jgi:hypothetical protein